MRRTLPYLIAAVIVAGVAAAYTVWSRPLSPEAVDAALGREYRYLEKHSPADMEMTLGDTAARAKVGKGWRKVRSRMCDMGAPNAEVREVERAARAHFDSIRNGKTFTYGVPLYAKRVRIGLKPLWIVAFGWGVGGPPPEWLTEPPSHIRVLAIRPGRRAKLLGMKTCG